MEKHCGEPLAACLQLLCPELLGIDCLPVSHHASLPPSQQTSGATTVLGFDLFYWVNSDRGGREDLSTKMLSRIFQCRESHAGK